MMTYASDFWPSFWLIIGCGALLTVLETLQIALFTPTRFSGHRHAAPRPPQVQDSPSAHLPNAAGRGGS